MVWIMEWSSKRMAGREKKAEKDWGRNAICSECYVSSLYQQEKNETFHDIPHTHKAVYQYLCSNHVSHDLQTDIFFNMSSYVGTLFFIKAQAVTFTCKRNKKLIYCQVVSPLNRLMHFKNREMVLKDHFISFV